MKKLHPLVMLVLVTSSAVVSGCLFPSLTEMEGNGGADAGAPSTPLGTPASTQADAGSGIPATGESPAGADAGSPDASPSKTIACGSTSCDPTTSVCCHPQSGASSCKPSPGPTKSADGCSHTLHCGDSSDCPGGKICCGRGDQVAVCQDDGIGCLNILCDPKAATPCPNEKSCDETFRFPNGATAPVCNWVF
jgi:hypothetical protein